MSDAPTPSDPSSSPSSSVSHSRPSMGSPAAWLWVVLFAALLGAAYYASTQSPSGRPASRAGVDASAPASDAQPPDTASEAASDTASDAASIDAAPVDVVGVSGAQVYRTRCVHCHQPDGEGITGSFPPLNRSAWLGDTGAIIRIVLHGLQGPITVRGVTYNGVMPGWAAMLDDAEVAAVLTHVRQSWDNDLPAVTPDAVAAVRAVTEGRTQPWTVGELQRPANRSVPERTDE